MVCRSCGGLGVAVLCGGCWGSLRRGGERRLPGGVLVRSALTHEGAARVLVHHLKYRGLLSAAGVLASAMEPIVPRSAECLVPVPRVMLRLWHYGIDPAAALAKALAARTGLPVVAALHRPLWWAGRAGPAAAVRGSPFFRARTLAPSGSVLVDDVLTTGATLVAAAGALRGVTLAVTATGPAEGGRGR